MAEGSWEGKPGVLSISTDSVEFSAKRSGGITRLAKSEIVVADLDDVRRIVRATRATFRTDATGIFRCTITAPAVDVARALEAR